MMAQKEWVAAGLEDTTDNDNFASLFRQDYSITLKIVWDILNLSHMPVKMSSLCRISHEASF